MGKITSVLLFMVSVMFVFTTIGCNDPQIVVENPPVLENNDSWSQEGEIQYKFPTPHQCLMQIAGQTYSIPRHEERGGIGELEWVWTRNGDVAVQYFDIRYDLKTPFSNEIFEGYEDIGGGSIMVWLGDELVIKDKAFLKDNPEYNKVYKRK